VATETAELACFVQQGSSNLIPSTH